MSCKDIPLYLNERVANHGEVTNSGILANVEDVKDLYPGSLPSNSILRLNYVLDAAFNKQIVDARKRLRMIEVFAMQYAVFSGS
mmetsp:Transcript_44692/g.83436  ORF Transcript_44692/g.83436 Transcript_44692/m.83436 type:complete len:84 (+) Transcript_44692:176-427(+)